MRSAPLIALLVFCGCTADIFTPPPKVEEPFDPGPPPPDPCLGTEDELLPPAPVPMRRLNRAHVEETVRSVLGVTVALPVTDERLFTYRSNVSASVDSQTVQAYFDWAEAVVAQLPLAQCTAAASCQTWLFDEVAPLFFRRPLEGEQRARYVALFQKGVMQGATPREGAQWVLEAMLQSPSFLYLDEPTTAGGWLDGYGVASRLSLMMWGKNPDAALLAKAAAGELATTEQVAGVVREMLKDPKSRQGLDAFVTQWLDLERLHQTNARPDIVALGRELVDAMAAEPVDLFRLAAISNQGLGDLFSTRRTQAAPALVRYYGAEALSTVDGVTSLDPARRFGLLTSAGVMAALAHAEEASPTLRGYAVLSNVMCKPPPPPPAGVSVTLPPAMPGATTRERLELHFSDATCASCHRAMDGMGFTFEHYDALGKWRDLEHGKPIVDSATFKLGTTEYTVDGAGELSTLLAARPEVSECFVRQWTRYATGIPEQAPVACYMKRLAREVSTPSGLEHVIVELASSDYVRKGNEP
ncbi:MAG: DUF1588 domain-containing protein [Myxococcaceae bacterium]|nr:DUF1588 domain-containing protein [Myxococcaceae bacterium]